MATGFPYTLYACPCGDDASTGPNSAASKRTSRQDSNIDVEEEHTFNSHGLRANYSLYPLDHLLFCDECNQIRCPKCWTEEIMYWYCPNCLFEVPSSGVKGDGNRCARHCYDCPICTATLSVTAVNRTLDTSNSNESYFLHCQYCDWSSLDIGIRLNKPTKVTEQLNKMRKSSIVTKEENGSSTDIKGLDLGSVNSDDTFNALTKFYKEQLSESSDQQNPYGMSPYSSPANLARIMSLYGGLSYNALKKTREKPRPMREAGNKAEGLSTFTAEDLTLNDEVLHKMQKLGLAGTTCMSQRLAMPVNFEAKFLDQLWPVATPLRIRRGKRCRTCRQFLARPEPKVGSMRYKIRLIALNYVQRMSLRPLQGPVVKQNSAFQLRAEPVEETKLQSHQAQQYILTLRNPVFETVKVTLATPATTPGKVASRITILCPSFTIGPAGDVWDEALSTSTTSTSDGGRRAAMASLTGSTDGDRQPEAGKIWERTRNSTSVILEIVPGSLQALPSFTANSKEGSMEEQEGETLTEGDDVLEIPIYVRAEWEADAHDIAEGLSPSPEKKRERENKELAYWCVLGVGRIAIG